ncbi:universal stress protein [Aquincola sp. MAHUQ-54]|uniref:Universal stress protein n=1 Tax=Aquincola agrisoli TaxID=3119538 RepID=A0AAW9Q9F4_9BURK
MSATTPPAMPAPDWTARDELGRLVAASWGTVPADRTGRTDTWLVAIDGSEGALRAAAMVVQVVAREAPATVDLVHVQPWLVKEAAEAGMLPRAWHASAAARALVERADIGWRLHVRMGDAAERIVALSRELGSRGIAIGSHGLTAAESLLLGSVAYKVVHLGQVPVLVVR